MAADSRFRRGRVRPGTLARLAYLAFIVVAVVLTLDLFHQALPKYLPKDWSHAHEFDGLVDWKAARYYLEGKSPYARESLREIGVVGFGHPPTTAFWFIPLARFEKALAAEVVGLSAFFFLLISVFLCARELKFPAPVAATALISAWVLTTDGMVMHWHAVQLSLHMALPFVLTWMFLRRGREIPAGMALGVAATIKLFPGVLMLFLLLARRWRAFFAASAVFVAVALVMTATYGLECWPLFLHQQGLIAQDWLGAVRNAGLQGIVLRIFTPICESQGSMDAIAQGFHHPDKRATFLAAGLGLALFASAYLVSRGALKRAREGDPRAVDLPFALFTVLAVFLNPWIWEHYHVFLIQPAFVLTAGLYESTQRAFRAWLDERASYRTLILEGTLCAVGALGLGAVIRMFSMDVAAKERMLELWRVTKDPWYHHYLHLLEVFNWLPWVIMLLLCLLYTWYWERLRKRASTAVENQPSLA